MGKRVDITNETFGRLTAIRPTGEKSSKGFLWLCECECGNTCTVAAKDLRSGNIRSCGCMRRRPYADLSDQTFGKLTALRYLPNKRRWLCQCECGNVSEVFADNLKRGHTTSCGCIRQDDPAGQKVDITEVRFGKLIAVRPTDQREHGRVVWECRCDCGGIRYASISNLKSGFVKSCGCLPGGDPVYEGTRISIIANTETIYSTNKSGVRGVSFSSRDQVWRADIGFQGRNFSLGAFADKAEAIKARKRAEEEIHGKFLEYFAEAYPEAWAKMQARKTKKQNE